MREFYAWLGGKKSARIRLAVMDMWKPFRLATNAHAPQAAILFDKFHIMRHSDHQKRRTLLVPAENPGSNTHPTVAAFVLLVLPSIWHAKSQTRP